MTDISGAKKTTVILLGVLLSTMPVVTANAGQNTNPVISPDQALLLQNILADAQRQGLYADKYKADEDAAAPIGADVVKRQRADSHLQKAIVAYARAMRGLRIPRAEFDKLWSIHPQRVDAELEFRDSLKKNALDAWLASLAPPFPEYRQLQAGLVAYLRAAAEGGWKPLRGGPDLHKGLRGTRVRALRERLAAEPLLQASSSPSTAAPAPADAQTFDSTLTDAVKQFQERHGLPPTGVVATETLNALNVSAAERARQIAANMERWRWLPRDRPASRIEVNVAADSLILYVDDQKDLRMEAAAGKPVKDDETPMLISDITSVIFNPPWNVPDDIAARELFPKERRDHSYFEREGFHIRKPGTGTRLVQEAGPKSALGRIKFEFKNAFGVYLHDTPERAAFSSSHRAVSHGCVRLEKPADLAAILLRDVPGWSPQRIIDMSKSTETVPVPLLKPVAVELLYWTAFPEGDGIAFRSDLYGWDGKLAKLLMQADRR